MALNNIKFLASLNADNVVENITTVNYSDRVIEYSVNDKDITNNIAVIGSTYDPVLNAFIRKKPDETYILNEDYEWEPNPELEYTIDGITHKWNAIDKEWYILQPEPTPEPEPPVV